MNNKICNPKTEVEKGTTLNDKDYLEGVLTICKDLEKNLTVAMTEASHEEYYVKHPDEMLPLNRRTQATFIRIIAKDKSTHFFNVYGFAEFVLIYSMDKAVETLYESMFSI